MNGLLEPLLELEGFQTIVKDIQLNRSPVLATGVIDAQQVHLACGLLSQLHRPAVFITSSELRAKEILGNLRFFLKQALYYPAKDIIFYHADVHSKEIVQGRFAVLDALLKGEEPVIVLSIEALFDRLVKKEIFASYVLDIHIGDQLPVDTLVRKLTLMGYERTEQVEGAGQFASRGGILDIYPPVGETPIRIEYWDDEIDSIRSMDSLSQRSIENLTETRIFPMRELVYAQEDVPKAAEKIEREYNETLANMEKKGMTEEAARLRETVGEALERLKEEMTFPQVGGYIHFFYEDTVSLLDYIPSNAILFLDEPQRIQAHGENVLFEFDDSIQTRIEKGYLLPSQMDMIYHYEDILHFCSGFTQVLFTTITQSLQGFRPKDMVSFSVRSTVSFQQRMDLFCEELLYLKKEGARIAVLSGSQARGERLVRELFERGVDSAFIDDIESYHLQRGTISVCRGRLSKGFQYQYIDLAVFSEQDLLGTRQIKRKPRKKKKKAAAIESFTDLRIGDYVVHDNHGIGVFRGLEKIVVDGVNKDYMKISYADGGSLFVPVNQMDMIQKYIGSESAAPKLNKLGGQDWNKAKTKAKAAVAILAEDLVKLYAKRQAAKGFAYDKDNVWQKEFEETFPYEETEDQLAAIEDVKRDMESAKVMDRLICGDVGYGKTEVAIRAAFKAVQDGKQVAYLVPTTILAQQHYNTFSQRMMDYPIRVDLLSRFRTAKQQKETLKALEQGYVDIIIGTHRLLSKDVKFKDLGLVIVDEEQRFGVSHKEKLKELKENVDVLTLTATPIPRTLHMSLSGIRDMSVLEEPPQERYPVQTYVMESSPEFVRDAIHRELNRGGQVYYLHNRVNNISEEAFRLQKLVPEANIAFAHGQMTERELESIMKDFIDGEIDVLVCTTIIETGLDIPNVNTIIIQDADRMGLSQLYQLRGRVGRSNKVAYAYLMYRRNKVLQEVAEKRLQTIKEFTEFGSGFKIAMRDLEIRGAGNLLGAQQHGHMEAVGYEMYCKLLNEAVKELKGEKVEEAFETTVDMNINAYIPSFYIENEEQKLEIYKKISQITTEEEYYDMQDEIEDRYGSMPKAVQTLLEVILLKAKAHEMGVISIVQKQANVVITFRGDAKVSPSAITELISKNKGKCMFTNAMEPYITVKLAKNELDHVMEFITSILQELNSFEE